MTRATDGPAVAALDESNKETHMKAFWLTLVLLFATAPILGCRAEGELGDGDADIEIDVDD
jgi:hypothetical protein